MKDSFLDTLQAETLSGTESLSAWLNHLATENGTAALFELEAWLRGMRSFFNLSHLPLTEAERQDLLSRSFGPETQVVYRAIQQIEKVGRRVLSLGQPEKLEFGSFVESLLRSRGAGADHLPGRILEQTTPLDSLSRFLEAMNDFRLLVGSLREYEVDYPVFLSLGRSFLRELQNSRYLEMLLIQHFKIQVDSVDNCELASMLRGIQSQQVRRDVSLAMMHLYRLLRYLNLVSRELAMDQPLRHTLVIFSLLHEEMGGLSQFLKSRFLRGQQAGKSLWSATELIVYSLRIESQRALERELVFVSREREAPKIYTKIDTSHGLLLNCFQNCIVTLAQAFDKSFDARAVFPNILDRVQEAQRLLTELWSLRQSIKNVLDKREEFDLGKTLDRLSAFRESSLRSLMYRDWGEFEQFSDAIVTASNFVEVRTNLRKFVGFLETLIQEVSKRTVLQESGS